MINVVATDRFIDPKFAAQTYGPLIFVRPSERSNAALLAHEQTHVRQWLRTLGTHGLFYRFSKDYRLAAEVEAYRAQQAVLGTGDDRTVSFAKSIATDYDLTVTPAEALAMLRGVA